MINIDEDTNVLVNIDPFLVVDAVYVDYNSWHSNDTWSWFYVCIDTCIDIIKYYSFVYIYI
jgi:hypothetical protein